MENTFIVDRNNFLLNTSGRLPPALPGFTTSCHNSCQLAMLIEDTKSNFTFHSTSCFFFGLPTAFSRFFFQNAKNSTTFDLMRCTSSSIRRQLFRTLYCPAKANFEHPDPASFIYELIPFDHHLVCQSLSRNARTDPYQSARMKQIPT